MFTKKDRRVFFGEVELVKLYEVPRTNPLRNPIPIEITSNHLEQQGLIIDYGNSLIRAVSEPINDYL